ncbi:MAG: pyridoxal-phosphate dependent enzyme [Gemmatimonadales bacterium]
MTIETTASPRERGLRALDSHPSIALFGDPTPLVRADRLRQAAGLPQTLLVKRDDVIPFGFGGNKVRKLAYQLAPLRAEGIDTVITCGGVQSNHARATAAAAAALDFRCHLVANGARPDALTGNALLAELLGASVEYVTERDQRTPAMERAAERFRAEGRHPTVVPLGASTPLGALGFAAAVGELLGQTEAPTVIVHAGSSGGTTAGLLAGLALHGKDTQVIGISADDPAAEVRATVHRILEGMDELLGTGRLLADAIERCAIDDGFVGDGYGVPSDASREAQLLAARREGFFVDHTYTAKALAGALACGRERLPADATILFWHTGGQVALFA